MRMDVYLFFFFFFELFNKMRSSFSITYALIVYLLLVSLCLPINTRVVNDSNLKIHAKKIEINKTEF